jgi:hypothetical protein
MALVIFQFLPHTSLLDQKRTPEIQKDSNERALAFSLQKLKIEQVNFKYLWKNSEYFAKFVPEIYKLAATSVQSVFVSIIY